MDFDEIIDRRGTHSDKWDNMEAKFGISPENGLAMWVADMDFRAPACVTQTLTKMTDHGVYGYFGDESAYLEAICWWMKNRHGWSVSPDAITTAHGLVNGTALCIQAFTEPGDGVVIFTPVYHAFARVIKASDREVVECPLVNRDNRYEMDFAAYDEQMTGRERMVILCSPHNPGGRVWTREELQQVADFAKRHDLILVSDEIHHDLVYNPGTHVPMATVDPSISDRLVMMTSTTKTFNIAGAHTGNVIVEDDHLRRRYKKVLTALGISGNAFGMNMATAAYSPEGAAWVDELVRYLDGNRALLDAGLNALPGVRSMPLEATYLAWVDFSGTGMSHDEALHRIEREAQIAISHGPTFGKGGDDFLRFNFAMPRRQIEIAVERMQKAFADLQ